MISVAIIVIAGLAVCGFMVWRTLSGNDGG